VFVCKVKVLIHTYRLPTAEFHVTCKNKYLYIKTEIKSLVLLIKVYFLQMFV